MARISDGNEVEFDCLFVVETSAGLPHVSSIFGVGYSHRLNEKKAEACEEGVGADDEGAGNQPPTNCIVPTEQSIAAWTEGDWRAKTGY